MPLAEKLLRRNIGHGSHIVHDRIAFFALLKSQSFGYPWASRRMFSGLRVSVHDVPGVQTLQSLDNASANKSTMKVAQESTLRHVQPCEKITSRTVVKDQVKTFVIRKSLIQLDDELSASPHQPHHQTWRRLSLLEYHALVECSLRDREAKSHSGALPSTKQPPVRFQDTSARRAIDPKPTQPECFKWSLVMLLQAKEFLFHFKFANFSSLSFRSLVRR